MSEIYPEIIIWDYFSEFYGKFLCLGAELSKNCIFMVAFSWNN